MSRVPSNAAAAFARPGPQTVEMQKTNAATPVMDGARVHGSLLHHAPLPNADVAVCATLEAILGTQ